jgi:hypothetical protein
MFYIVFFYLGEYLNSTLHYVMLALSCQFYVYSRHNFSFQFAII